MQSGINRQKGAGAASAAMHDPLAPSGNLYLDIPTPDASASFSQASRSPAMGAFQQPRLATFASAQAAAVIAGSVPSPVYTSTGKEVKGILKKRGGAAAQSSPAGAGDGQSAALPELDRSLKETTPAKGAF